jgi:hypothetical protein
MTMPIKTPMNWYRQSTVIWMISKLNGRRCDIGGFVDDVMTIFTKLTMNTATAVSMSLRAVVAVIGNEGGGNAWMLAGSRSFTHFVLQNLMRILAGGSRDIHDCVGLV